MEFKDIECNDKKVVEIKETADEYRKNGNEFYYKKDYHSAIKCYDMAISIDNNYSPAYYNRGLAHYNMQEYDKAIEYYTKAIKINPKIKEAYLSRGIAYYTKCDYDKAIEDYSKVIKIQPDNKSAYNNRGNAYFYKKEYNRAIRDYNKTIEIEPNNGIAHCNRANVYYNMKKYNESIKDYSTAIEANPEDILAYSGRARAYNAVGEFDKSEEDESRAKTLKEFNDYVKVMDFDKGTQKNIWDLFLVVSELKRTFLNTSPKRVGHYTKISTLKFLIKSDKLNGKIEDEEKKPRLRLNNVAYMNDPAEGVVFLELLKQVSKDAAELVDNLYATGNIGSRQKLMGKNTFLVSLSNNIDTSLPMWTQYTDDGEGACIVFNPEFFDYKDDSAIIMKCEDYESSEIHDNDDFKECYCLYGVQYMKWNDKTQKYQIDDINLQKSIESICHKIIELRITEHEDKEEREKLKAATQNLLDQIRFLFKDEIYAYEAEERIIKSESDPNKVKFTGDNEGFAIPHTYIEIDKPLMIDEVILGPKVKNPTEAANYIYFTDKDISVSKSRIQYQ